MEADPRTGMVFAAPSVATLPAVIARRLLVAGITALAMVAPAGAAPLPTQLSPDQSAPSVRLFAPRYASDHSVTARFRLRWRGEDQGSGIARYKLEVRSKGSVSTRWRPVVHSTRQTSAVFRGRPGTAYLFRLRARDQVGNLSRFSYGDTVVPLDEWAPQVGRSHGWRPVVRRRAYGHILARAVGRGHIMRLVFRGTRAAVIGSRSRMGGRLLVRIDGRPAVVRLRGRPRYRAVLFRSRQLRTGLHLLRVETLGGGLVDIDGFGIDTGPTPPRR
jgi:hypothetical protein